MGRFECHAHTMYSNVRLLDCINRPEQLIDRAVEIGLKGIAITDHELLGAHVVIDKYEKEIQKKHPDFKVAKGNEIYLTDNRESGQKYFHFILIAKNATGHKMLRELSTIAWSSSYVDRRMERVPTLKSELKDIIEKYGKGNLIASSACLGSEIDYCILKMYEAEQIGDINSKREYYQAIVNFMNFVQDLFGEDFYLEVQPAQSEEQLIVNRKMKAIADYFNCKIIVTTDAHYLKESDREVHKAYLNSKGGEREVDSFYKYAYLQTTEEVIKNLEGTGLDYYELEKNTHEIYDKIENYSFQKKQKVPEVEVTIYPKKSSSLGYKTLDYMYQSDNVQERYWVNYCIDKLKELDLYNETYLSRLEEEADIQKTISDKLETCMFAYPIFLQHYINLFWECGSTVGAGRGCFTPDMLVTLANGQVKPISDIQKNEQVLSAKGNIKTVEDVLKYPCQEKLYKIIPKVDADKAIECTNNHEFWVLEGGICGVDRVQCSKNCTRTNCKKKASFNKRWKRADELTQYDYIFYPKPTLPLQDIQHIDCVNYLNHQDSYIITDSIVKRKNSQGGEINRYIPVDENFMYVLGVCIGDGWTTVAPDKNCLGIAFNSGTEKDQKSMDLVKKYFEGLGFAVSICKHKTKNLNQLYVYSKPLAVFFEKMIGKGASNKQIPAEFLFDNKKLMTSLLRGLLASDGSYDKDALRFSYDSINYSLISQIKMLCAYLNIFTYISTRAAHDNCAVSYKLRAGGPQLNSFIGQLDFKYSIPSANRTQQGVIVEDEGFFYPIQDIQTFEYNGFVYDLTVEDDHCYMVNNAGVHNSACSGLNHYLLGVTQLDPIKYSLPYWRYLNRERLELGDIDIDICPSKREEIFDKIREERGQFGCIQVCTYGTESTKSAIKTACRGYRSKEFPDGIDIDIAEYMSSLIPQERGFLWPLHDVVYGDKEKDRRPIRSFLNEVNKYSGLLDIMLNIEGLICRRGIHASGVNFYGEDPFETACFMKAKNGSMTTQYSLHDAEYCSDVKYDFLVTEVQDVLVQWINLVQEYNLIDPELTLREVYNQYLHPDVLPINDEKMWQAVSSGQVLKFFQLT